jgi:GT2 family glycosyltransferase
VVVSFNRGIRLVGAIEGLRKQTRRVDEIIVVETVRPTAPANTFAASAPPC